MRLACSVLSLLILSGAGPRVVRAQDFGHNPVRVRQFDWKVSSTEHFDIHYYEDSAPLVPFAAKILERSYRRISKGLKTEFTERKPFFLYACADDMQQSNIVQVGDGTGGVTEAFKDRFMVFNDGSRQWLDTVATHELAHVFQYHVLISGFWRTGRILKSIVYPLWMMEGMAELYAWGLDDTSGEIIVRDAATSGGLIPVWKLEHFSHLKPHQVRLAYELGEKILSFIETEYGHGKVAQMLKLFESRFETSSVLQELIGLDTFEFERRWREYAEEHYGRIRRRQRLQEPDKYGVALTTASGEIPEFNTSPVFSPDGRHMAFLSTRAGYPAGVFLQDLRTGKIRKLVSNRVSVENVHTGNFTNQSRVLSISKDGRWLAFSGTKNHRPAIQLYDLRRHRLEHIPVKDMQTVTGTSFSPDGRTIAFTGMKNAVTDIYLMDLESREIRQLTDDSRDDQTPDFSPDGESIVYSAELETPGGDVLYQRRLYRIRLADGSIAPLLDIPGSARDPYHAADGRRLLFSLEHNGFHEVYELNLESRKTYRLTRSVGAAYTPAYSPDGRIVFAGFRRGSIHVYRGGRERFEAELWSDDAPQQEERFAPVPVSTAAVSLSLGRPFRDSFSTDLFLPAFFYSTEGGFFWASYWQGSDMLGNHQVLSALSYASGSGYLDYQTVYSYNKYRTKFRVGGLGRARRDLLDERSGLSSNEYAHAEFVGATYPLDRFHRLDFSATSVSDSRLFLGVGDTVRNEARIGQASFVRDTVRGRYLVATSGDRFRLSYQVSPRLLGGNFIYETASAEAHKYVPTGGRSALVLRGLGVGSWGRRTPRYALGGIGGARGFARSTTENSGSHMALATAEWRVPIVNLDYYMWYIFPDFYFKALSLALFTDAGYAWDERPQIGRMEWEYVRHSYGIGLRIHTFIMQLFPLVVHFDYAQKTTDKGRVFYVYLGPLF
ncbi:MAG: BamA/TamA family outer membrane protein [Elusimicrobiota bacterium]